jgi:hypothetical protein
MATIAPTLPKSFTPLVWLKQFLKEELAPYPGRGALVARMITEWKCPQTRSAGTSYAL